RLLTGAGGIEPGSGVIEAPPGQVLVDGVGWHDAIDPGGYPIWRIVGNCPCVRIDDQHFAELVARVAARWLHQGDRPEGMETVVKLQRGINKFAVGIATQVSE